MTARYQVRTAYDIKQSWDVSFDTVSATITFDAKEAGYKSAAFQTDLTLYVTEDLREKCLLRSPVLPVQTGWPGIKEQIDLNIEYTWQRRRNRIGICKGAYQ